MPDVPESSRRGSSGAGSGQGGERGGGRARLPRRNVAVSEVSHLTPQLIRIVATGELEDWSVSGGPGGHFKVFIPEAGSEEHVMRTYTVREYDGAAGRLTVDFAVHADGPATSWAVNAAPGAPFQISGAARSGYEPSDGAGWTVFVADQSALPAVAAIVEALPAGYPVRALIEVPATDEQLGLDSRADLRVEWIVERDGPCEQLVAAAAALELPSGEGDIWVGCEADAMRRIRRNLLHDRGLSPRALHTRAYWKRNVANHSDHDTGDDVD
jgi:NADPH-dependent ferric siderophore reductase